MLGLALTFLIIGVWVFAIIDIIGTPSDSVRVLPKPIWLLAVVLFAFVGAVAWMLFGRPSVTGGYGGYDGYGRRPSSDHPAFGGRGPWGAQRRTGSGDQLRPGISRAGMRRQTTRPVGPDDDPEFLRELSNRIRGEDGEPPVRG